MKNKYKILFALICVICVTCALGSRGYGATMTINGFNAGEMSPLLEGRTDFEKWYSGCRTLENMLAEPWGDVAKRPGTYYIVPAVTWTIPGSEGTPAVLGTYKYTYISDNTFVWGLPLSDGSIIGLDADDAVNVGGGIVGINYDNAADDGTQRFVEGDSIVINGTDNYDGAYALTAGTSVTQLQFTKGYSAESFDGTETVVKLIEYLPTSSGHMVQDSSGNLYYGHSLQTNYYITKILTNGSTDPDYNWLDGSWDVSKAGFIAGLALTPDDQYLYAWISGNYSQGYLYKYDLTTGNLVWTTIATGLPGAGYDLSIDSDGNAYVGMYLGTTVVNKFAASDGTRTALTLMGQAIGGVPVSQGLGYVSVVDNDLGIVIGGGYQQCSSGFDESVLYNLAVRTFDDTKGARMALGGTYTAGGLDYTYILGTGVVATHDGYIYALCYTPTSTLYKIQWDSDAQTLTVIDSAAGPTDGQGIYFDLWGNLVVVNQDYSVGQSDVIYFYDTGLNQLAVVDNMQTTMFSGWDAPTGGAWIHGEAVFNGELGTAEVPGSDAYEIARDTGYGSPVRLIDCVVSTEVAYVIEMGDKYFRFLK